ncbi:MAG: hypothetical protein LBK62_02015 [Treponema sp.]|nr:hypothetical protein [Treponema sp.]
MKRCGMEVVVRFAPSAFKHGSTREDIYHMLNHAEYDDVLDDDNEKHLVLGFDAKANLLEILYNVIDEQTVKVSHAMPCTHTFRALLDR